MSRRGMYKPVHKVEDLRTRILRKGAEVEEAFSDLDNAAARLSSPDLSKTAQ